MILSTSSFLVITWSMQWISTLNSIFSSAPADDKLSWYTQWMANSLSWVLLLILQKQMLH